MMNAWQMSRTTAVVAVAVSASIGSTPTNAQLLQKALGVESLGATYSSLSPLERSWRWTSRTAAVEHLFCMILLSSGRASIFLHVSAVVVRRLRLSRA